MKVVVLTEEQVKSLAEGRDVELELSPKRTLVLGTKTIAKRQEERLEARYEAARAKLRQKYQGEKVIKV